MEYIPDKSRKAKADEIINECRKNNIFVIPAAQSKDILKLYGINVASTYVCKNAQELIKTAHKIKYPVVAKLHSTCISHKSDLGGVFLNIRSDDELYDAYNHISTCTSKENIQGVTIEKMIENSKGYEVVLGSYYDQIVGPVLMFGTGGTMVEIFKDTVVALPLMTIEGIKKLVRKTKISKAFLSDSQRYPKIALGKLYLDIQNFSLLVHENRDTILECEINPLLAEADGTYALDARISIRR